MRKASQLATTIAIVAILLLSGCAQTPIGKVITEEPIKIGYFGPMTGGLAYSGTPVYESFELAHNERPTVDGKAIQVIYEDDMCNSNEAVKVASKLINVDKVKILVTGICSSSMLAVAPIAEQNKVILISPAAASPKISDAGEYVFRLASTSNLAAQETAEILINQGMKRVSILYEQNDYPAGWKDAFTKTFESLGGEIVNTEGFETGAKDMKTQITKLKSENQDAVLFLALSATSAELMLKQARELGIKDQIIGNEVFSFKSIIRQNSEIAENLLVSTYKYDLQSPEMKELLNDYKQEYGREITEEIYGALGYDTYMTIYNAIKKCDGDNPECIKKELGSVIGVTGASGTFTLDNKGDAVREFVLRRVRNGELIALE